MIRRQKIEFSRPPKRRTSCFIVYAAAVSAILMSVASAANAQPVSAKRAALGHDLAAAAQAASGNGINPQIQNLVLLVEAFSNTDFKINEASFEENFQRASVEVTGNALAAALSEDDLAEALAFARSNEGAAEIRSRQKCLGFTDQKAPTADACSSTPAGEAFNRTAAGEALIGFYQGNVGDRAQDVWASTIEIAEQGYCRTNKCTGLQHEFFKRVRTISAPSRSKGSHAMNGQAAEDLFVDVAAARLAKAACEGTTEMIKPLIATGADPNATGREGMVADGSAEVVTPLLWAIDCGDVAGLKALLEVGADPNRSGKYGVTAVTAAARSEIPELLTTLLAHGGNPNSHTDSQSSLEIAFEEGVSEEFDGAPEAKAWANWNALINAGADLNQTGGTFGSLATFAAGLRRFDKVDWLLEHGWHGDYVSLGRSVTTYLELVEKRAVIPEFAATQKPWVDKVQARLEQTGVRFPVPPLAQLKKDVSGFYVQD